MQYNSMRVAMDRSEAVTYLKELLTICSDMSPQALSVENNHIKGPIDDSYRQAVLDVAKRNSLQVKEEKDETVIYRPK